MIDHYRSLKRFVATGILMATMTSTAFAEGLVAEKAWVRAMPPNVSSSAAYVVLTNTIKQPIVITEVRSSAARMVQLHEHIMDGDMMQMREVDSVTIAANGQFVFSPGGYHIMLMGLTSPLKPGNSVRLTVITEKQGSIDVTAEISKEGFPMPSMGHMH